MFVSIQFVQFCIENLFFLFSVKNIVMKNSIFTKFMYSDDCCMMNSLFFEVPFIIHDRERYFHKTRFTFDTTHPENLKVVRNICDIETKILRAYVTTNNKKPNYKIHETLYQGTISCNSLDTLNSQPKLHLKLFGVWENATEYGMTYKFIQVPDTVNNNNNNLTRPIIPLNIVNQAIIII